MLPLPAMAIRPSQHSLDTATSQLPQVKGEDGAGCKSSAIGVILAAAVALERMHGLQGA